MEKVTFYVHDRKRVRDRSEDENFSSRRSEQFNLLSGNALITSVCSHSLPLVCLGTFAKQWFGNTITFLFGETSLFPEHSCLGKHGFAERSQTEWPQLKMPGSNHFYRFLSISRPAVPEKSRSQLMSAILRIWTFCRAQCRRRRRPFSLTKQSPDCQEQHCRSLQWMLFYLLVHYRFFRPGTYSKQYICPHPDSIDWYSTCVLLPRRYQR